MDLILNIKVQKIQNLLINFEVFENDLVMKNRDFILDSEENEFMQKYDVVEDEE